MRRLDVFYPASSRSRASSQFPGVEVTLKTADALLILEAGRKIKEFGSLPLENRDEIS